MSTEHIEKVAVIGAGTMGSGIAAHLANADVPVLLLDLPGLSERAIQRLQNAETIPLMEPENAGKIEVGDVTNAEDFAKLADCDWICEAVVERLDVKQDLYQRIAAIAKPKAFVTSNTSTIPIRLLVEQMDSQFRSRFAITHFFNPVRQMRLLELVRGESTQDHVIDKLADFCDRKLGKGVVQCADTPGFLGNRVGVFALQVGLDEAQRNNLKIEQADAVMGRPMGIPKTGIFGLYDMIGLDLMSDVVRSLRSILPEDDAFHDVGAENAVINELVQQGFNGIKGEKGGFYTYAPNPADKTAINYPINERRPYIPNISTRALQAEQLGLENGGLTSLLQGDDPEARFAWRVLARVLIYSAQLIPSVTNSPQDIDDAMKLGYNWVKGPFELLDLIGIDTFIERAQRDGFELPPFLLSNRGKRFYRAHQGELKVLTANGTHQPLNLPDGVIRFHHNRQTMTPIVTTKAASLYALSSGKRLLEFHTKANALTDASMEVVSAAADDHGTGIVVHCDTQHFSAGVNLEDVLAYIHNADWNGLDGFLHRFQRAVKALRYCPAPVIAAPSGLAIGGGFEVVLHCDRLLAHANSTLGLVESLVGVIPGGGGVKETYRRWYDATGDWSKAAYKTFQNIGYGATGTSPALAAKLQYFRPDTDRQIMNRDRLVTEALDWVETLNTAGYRPPTPPTFELAGVPAVEAMAENLENGLAKGIYVPHDQAVGLAIGEIVAGATTTPGTSASEDDLFFRERQAFVGLAKTPLTRKRIEHMLQTGTALRE